MQCVCHNSSRNVHFTSSLPHPACWCGLTSIVFPECSSQHEIAATTQNLDQGSLANVIADRLLINDQLEKLRFFIPNVPLTLNGRFWKARANDLFKCCPGLRTVLKDEPRANSPLYFFSNYLVGQVAGHGAFSKARQGLRWDKTKAQWTPVALKFYFRGACARKRAPQFTPNGDIIMLNRWDRIKAELVLHSRLQHPNLAKLLELHYEPLHDVLIVVMEYVSYRALTFDRARQQYNCPKIDQKNYWLYNEVGTREVLRQVLCALDYLHNNHQMIHKDIKPENILLTKNPPFEWLRKVTENSAVAEASSSTEGFDYEGISGCTEEFLWEDDKFSEDGSNERENSTLSEKENDEAEEKSMHQKCNDIALNVHLQIHGRTLTVEEKIGLLGVQIDSGMETHMIEQKEDNECLKYSIPKVSFKRVKASNNSNTTENIILRSLKGGKPSEVYCFCCGMRTIDDMVRRNRQWEFEDNLSLSEDSNYNSMVESTTPNNTVANQKDNLFKIDTPDGRNDTNGTPCVCCSCHVNFPIQCSSDDSVLPFKKRKIEEKDKPQRENTSPIVKLIDFNSAVQTKPPDFLIYDSEGSRHFIPPECFDVEEGRSGILGIPRDMWSIGCLLYCLIYGDVPFNSNSPIGLVVEIQKSPLLFPDTPTISEALKDLIRGLLDKNPKTRSTHNTIMSHPWMNV